MIELRGIEKAYAGRTLFAGFDCVFERGKTTVITGVSGSGKSTLLRLLNQLERQDEGTLRVGDLEIPAKLPHAEWRRRAHSLRRRVGMVFQGYQLFPHLDVLQNVTLAPVRAFGVEPRIAEQRALELLAAVGMDGHATVAPRDCQAVSRNASPSRARSRHSPRFCCSTSRRRRSIRAARRMSCG